MLIWGLARWLTPQPISAVQRLIEESRPMWVRLIRACFRGILNAYVLNLVLMFVNGPLILASQNVVSPVSLLIGPPMVLLTTLALLCGVVQLPLGLLSPALAMPFGFVTGMSLSAARGIVRFADGLSWGTVYSPALPGWWMILFYSLLIAYILSNSQRVFLILLLLVSFAGVFVLRREVPDEMRITFLAVGHGGCTVIESPDGRVIVYDAGTMAGSDTVRRIIAPFLWCRGIRRIDALILSHADLDHYNGVPELLRRFPVGEVLLSPSFAEKSAPEVAEVLLALEAHGVPRRTVVRGDSLRAGEVSFEVLHPPAEFKAETENERSLVLKIQHLEHVILLTGDLEKSGTARLLASPPVGADVLMAPHHGSAAAFPAALADWAKPKLTVVSRGNRVSVLPVETWDTWTNGAITLRSHASGLSAEAFRTGQRRVVSQ